MLYGMLYGVSKGAYSGGLQGGPVCQCVNPRSCCPPKQPCHTTPVSSGPSLH